ncbi:MAG: hypothetical protein WBL88_06755 [Nitrososphaeraceae archaeon]
MLHKWSFKPKVPQKRFINIASKGEKERFKKNAKEIISNVSKEEGFTVVVEDESIFIHDAVVRRRM